MAIDFIGSENLAAGRIHFQYDSFDMVILLGAFELRLDHVRQIVSALVHDPAGNNAADLDDGDFVHCVMVFGDNFFELWSDAMAGVSCQTEAAGEQVANMEEDAKREQNQQDDSENHPAASTARLLCSGSRLSVND